MSTSILGITPMLFWLGATIILAIFEIFSMGLTTIWFALGAFFAFLSALLGAALPLQIVIFILISVLSLLLVRPLSLKYLNSRVSKTNIDALIGRQVLVTKDIDNKHEQGTVSMDGTTWNARCTSDDERIAKGEMVFIHRIEGNKVYVSK